jgi:hypothetical protein
MLASMHTALKKACDGSACEDGYFLEKLEKAARAMGYELTRPITHSEPVVDSGVIEEISDLLIDRIIPGWGDPLDGDQTSDIAHAVEVELNKYYAND